MKTREVPMAALSDVREKLGRGTWLLIIGTGTIQERVRSAYMVAQTLRPEDFPDPGSREIWLHISSMLTSTPPTGNEGPLHAALRRMGDLKASEIAGEFFELSERVRRFQEIQEWMLGSEVGSREQSHQTRSKNSMG
jgi:hypothetical protein